MKAISLDQFCQQTTEMYMSTYMQLLGLKYNYTDFRANVRTYSDFINQPFTPEMIVEKFKGWSYDRLKNQYYSDFIINSDYYVIEFHKSMFFIFNDVTNQEYRFKFLPKTLADFITFCSYAEIELEFKEQ